MASSPVGSNAPIRTLGRGFALMDPERQREVVGYVRASTVDAPQGRGTERAARATRADWVRASSDRDSSNYEGSSSRRGH